jgi:hypothetical protein
MKINTTRAAKYVDHWAQLPMSVLPKRVQATAEILSFTWITSSHEPEMVIKIMAGA